MSKQWLLGPNGYQTAIIGPCRKCIVALDCPVANEGRSVLDEIEPDRNLISSDMIRSLQPTAAWRDDPCHCPTGDRIQFLTSNSGRGCIHLQEWINVNVATVLF